MTIQLWLQNGGQSIWFTWILSKLTLLSFHHMTRRFDHMVKPSARGRQPISSSSILTLLSCRSLTMICLTDISVMMMPVMAISVTMTWLSHQGHLWQYQLWQLMVWLISYQLLTLLPERNMVLIWFILPTILSSLTLSPCHRLTTNSDKFDSI
jgi:hypothetical protein